ncbi:Histone deacetylase phd1 [Paraphaeosphaeria sporulosa]
MRSRASLAKSPNGGSEDDEDVSGSSSFSDDRHEQSDADNEDSDLYTNEREEQYPEESSESTRARPSARGNRSAAPVDHTQVEADASLARDLGVRRSGRNQGQQLGRLHYLGLYSQPKPAKTKKALIKEEHSQGTPTTPNSYFENLWISRKAEEDRAHSFSNPFLPREVGDVDRWIAQGPSPPLKNPYMKTQVLEVDLVQQKVAMRAQSFAPPMNGQANGIVQEWLSPNDTFQEDFSVFKTLSDDEQQAVIRREAEQHGLEKPQGYNVSFHYNPHVEYHHFGSSHPMKPWRLTLTKQLVLAYGLEYTMDCYEPRPARFDELAVFHDREYLSFLSQVTPQNAKPDDPAYLSFGFGGESNDCPVFDGLWNYVSIYSGASINAANNLNNKQSDIAINWSGGLHHAKKNLASGFCYINDIVLAIQLLLTNNPRVLYIDIDVHHGDGVEAAFESSDRVFTLSYHKYGIDRNGYPFFPGTGNIHEMGPTDPANRGKGHSLNIPIDDGIDDEQYKWLFKTVTGAVIEKYNPTAIVLQSGADSLGGDRLGRFNLNIKAHGFCVETVKSYGRPLLLIGGGGYTPRNVARTWCHETAVCVGAELHNELPTHIPYIQAFEGAENGGGILYPDLHNTKRHDNLNTQDNLHKLVTQALENLRYIEGAPSVVCNTMGLTEEQIMKVRAMVDEEFEDDAQDRGTLTVENTRRRKERGTGGRGERGLR